MSGKTREPQSRILVAEDDPGMQELLERILQDEGYAVEVVGDGLAAMARLGNAPAVDLVLTDLRMPGADGIQLLEYVQQKLSGTPVVVLTAFGSIPGAVDAMRLGAFDYLAKPLPNPQALRDVIRRALDAGGSPGGVELVSCDPAMERVVQQVHKVAPRDTTVLLLGESGTGKEVLARMLHERSPRSEDAFVAINCAALTESLLESELFGHEKGAFTGATSRHEGRFEQARGGTLFLDEMGETSPALQAKLLRVLQEKTFERVGGEQELTADVRLVAATNRDLDRRVEEGLFRQDLYYRLAVFPIQIPPLRQRGADVLPLAEHFLHLLTRGPSRTAPSITPGAKDALRAHRWPGNVRELQNVMERALILSGGDPITEAELNLPVGPEGPKDDSVAGTLKEMERRAIVAALDAEDGNRKRAAGRLGIALRTLQYKIKEYGL